MPDPGQSTGHPRCGRSRQVADTSQAAFEAPSRRPAAANRHQIARTAYPVRGMRMPERLTPRIGQRRDRCIPERQSPVAPVFGLHYRSRLPIAAQLSNK